MADDWQRFCASPEFLVEGASVKVRLDDGRSHRVRVTSAQDGWQLLAVVAGAAIVASLDDASVHAWLRNRRADLVGFRIDRRGRLVADAWLSREGTDSSEFEFVLLSLAREADRWEFQLTGGDRC